MAIEFVHLLGWGCVAWTVVEFFGLATRARRIARFRRPAGSRFDTRDLDAEAIDIDVAH